MAQRLNKSVVKGEIDNRTPGEVTGKIWLVGHDSPIQLKLKGNPLRDLAGCLVTFSNPAPEDDQEVSINTVQNGVVGDITGSRKVHVPDVSLDDMMSLIRQGARVPEHIGNCLYIEWFSLQNGRVVVESTDFTISVSMPSWEMSEQQEQEQLQANQETIMDFLNRLVDDSNDPGSKQDTDKTTMDEFQWEKYLKESDARAEKYGKLLEKYEGHPDQEKLVAREMNWTWLEEAIEADERGKLDSVEDEEDFDEEDMMPVPNPLTQGVDWVRDENGCIQHPLTLRAVKLSSAMLTRCRQKGVNDEANDEDLVDLIFQIQMTAAKLAGALNSVCYDTDIEGGLIVAWLKRALNYLHKSIGALHRVVTKELISLDEFVTFRKELFSLREEILRLMEHYRIKT